MKTFSQAFVREARVLAVLCAGLFWSFTSPAQPAEDTVDSRFLLIFDTSSGMKPRVPRVQYAVERLFFSMMNGQLQSGNDIGVWAFDRKLRTGELPLQRWLPQNAATIASRITNFVERQHYSRSTRFDSIMPAVNGVVRNSQRVTVLIFCDGTGQIQGTPYDDAINSSFKKNERVMAKAKETFIVLLRAQSGKYTGYSINSSAAGVDFPEFPPLPESLQATAAPPTNQPPPLVQPTPAPAPAVQLPPLVIVGTNVSSNLLPPTSAKPTVSNSPTAKVESSPPPTQPLSGSTNAGPTNGALSKIAGGSTNAMAPAAKNSGLSRQGAMTTGAILLAVATLVILLGLIRSRRPGGPSLITKSMNKK